MSFPCIDLMEIAEFRNFGHLMVDWIADYYEDLEQYPVVPGVEPGDIKKSLSASPPETGESMVEIFLDFKEKILPGITHWQHPGWFAYFPANTSPASILGEFLMSGLGAQCMIWKTSPSAAELEEVVIDWLRQMLGMPEGFSGVIQDSASTSTLVALLSAREMATGFDSNKRGIQPRLVVYTSTEAHSSVIKGVKIAGYGEDNIRYIPTDDTFAMIPEELEKAINEDIEKGFKPSCVCATVGTTSSCGIDPIAKLGPICTEHKVWLHVDGAFGGSAAILPEKRWMLQGIEFVDSFVFNPHKWLLTNFDCSAYFVKDEGALIRTFEIHPEYLRTGVDSQVKNYRDWGVPLGRRFRALKLWFVLRSYGVEGLQEMIRRHLSLAQWFKDRVDEHDHLELMAPVDLSLVCFRLNDGRDREELDGLNKIFLERINSHDSIFLTHTSLKGRFAIRMSIGSRTTKREHVEGAWEIIRNEAEKVINSKP